MLIDVTKNEITGRYEVETDVKPTPSGGTIAYAWHHDGDNITIYTQSATPSVGDPVLWYDNDSSDTHKLMIDTEYGVEVYDSDTDTINWDSGVPYLRTPQSDIELW